MVEDDEMVRNATRKMLEARGYQVPVADSGSEAIRIAREHAGSLPLLRTDVVLPEMSGPELAEKVHAVRPTIRTIFVSGYTDDTIVHHGVLAAGVNFLQKPFTSSGLAQGTGSAGHPPAPGLSARPLADANRHSPVSRPPAASPATSRKALQ